MDHYDVIIIGTGAGGGTLAHRLAPSGKKVLLLERGGYLPREPQNWDSKEVFRHKRYVTTERWYDKHGVPFRPHAQYFVGGNTEPHKRLLIKLKDLLGPIGCHQTSIPRWSVLSQQIPIAGIAHNCGTVRFGTDPRRSALDVNCKAHDVDNLYVVDTSFFPSSGAVNPALTAMANALRVGDHLLERLGPPSAASSDSNRKFERSDTHPAKPDAIDIRESKR
jgi:choline dehydrogenase-like flavoprotein